ncbi:MAG TPA: acetyl-CoA carboxylase carboxyltransferase subunit alpha [Candidatus Binatia bacterium]|nr:acetyl-CoA carboxylase carboxyltransferase subunit alpha [Candidatus Binatia bacterium]
MTLNGSAARSVPLRAPAAEATAWERVRRARDAARPRASDYLAESFTDFIELHGDRAYRDDPAIRAGVARLAGRPVVVVAQERGRDHDDQVRRSFGMAFPEGYRKAERLMRLAEHFGLPVVTLVDTPGAHPGLGAEERGQAGAIARTLACMATLRVPTVAVVIGQGGSGGALALALTDRVLMLEHAFYGVISPEGCASILWRSSARAPEAAAALRLTAPELRAQGIVDEVIPEPRCGIARAPAEAAARVRRALDRTLRSLERLDAAELLARRAARYTALGAFAVVDAGGEEAP